MTYLPLRNRNIPGLPRSEAARLALGIPPEFLLRDVPLLDGSAPHALEEDFRNIPTLDRARQPPPAPGDLEDLRHIPTLPPKGREPSSQKAPEPRRSGGFFGLVDRIGEFLGAAPPDPELTTADRLGLMAAAFQGGLLANGQTALDAKRKEIADRRGYGKTVRQLFGTGKALPAPRPVEQPPTFNERGEINEVIVSANPGFDTGTLGAEHPLAPFRSVFENLDHREGIPLLVDAAKKFGGPAERKLYEVGDNIVDATNPDAPRTIYSGKRAPTAQSDLGRLQADYEAGLITDDQYALKLRELKATVADRERPPQRTPGSVVNMRMPDGKERAFRTDSPELDRAIAAGAVEAGNARTSPTLSGDFLLPMLSKIRDGIQLTPGEQRALDTYQRLGTFDRLTRDALDGGDSLAEPTSPSLAEPTSPSLAPLRRPTLSSPRSPTTAPAVPRNLSAVSADLDWSPTRQQFRNRKTGQLYDRNGRPVR